MRWVLNISGVAEYINLGPGDSGSFIAGVLRNNQPTLYTLKLVATDSHRLSGSSTKLFTVVLFNQTQQNLTENHWLETEYATIGLPMAVYNDSQASNGRYIGSYVSDGYGQLQFIISNPGIYYLWMRTKWSGGSSNSLFVSVDNQPEIEFGNDYTFNGWHWINSFQSHEVPEIVTLQLSAGSHLIKIRGREAGGLFGVDKILLTGNPNYIPNELGESGENKPLPPQQQTLFFDNFERYPLGLIPLAWASNTGTWQVVVDGTNTYEGYMGAGNAYSYPNNQSHLNLRNYRFESKFKILNSSTGIGFIGYHTSGRAYQIRYRSFPGQIFIEDISNFNGELGQDLRIFNYSLQKDIWYRVKVEFETQTSKTIIKVKIWNDAENEPSTWLITYEDTRSNRIQQGGFGYNVRHLANRFDDIKVTRLPQ
ncbi:hypothetical protein J4455_05685 [Candidatus Woesearchaeota archaeon]|nr:hypothetical protein [Candidatus Woesearchaeota archaeon]